MLLQCFKAGGRPRQFSPPSVSSLRSAPLAVVLALPPSPLCALAGARRRASPPPLLFEGPARPPLPCVLGCLKNTTLFARGCLIFVLWLYRMICYFNASRREGALASSLRLRCPLCVRRRWRSSWRCPPPPFAPLRGLGDGLVLLRFSSKDPPVRLCRVSLDVLKIPRYLPVGVLYLFCGYIE